MTDISPTHATAPNGEPTTLGRYNGFDIYPMPFFVRLLAPDPIAVAAWYEEALGFAVVFRGPVTHLRRMKYQDILIVPGPSDAPEACRLPVLTFGADGEIDALAERAAAVPALGRSMVSDPVDTRWNTREVTVVDPLGHVLVFTSRREDPDPAVETRWSQHFAAGLEPR